MGRGKKVKVSAADCAFRMTDAMIPKRFQYITHRGPVTNMDKVIRFELDGTEVVRQLVPVVRQVGQEISIASPVGMRLANANPGQEFVIPRPGTDEFSVVKVLSIEESVAQVGA